MPIWLLVLGAGALVFYTDDYVIAGVIPEIAGDLGVSAAKAGQLVTAFSLTVAIASPVIAVGAARVPGRALLGAAAVVFTAANVLAALAPGYPLLLALRVLAALAAAAATPVLFGTAASLAPPERVGRYVAVVAFGVTGAIAVGVPVGTWVGGAFGWRATFALMAVAGAVFGAAAVLVLPRQKGVREALPVRRQLAILARPAVSLGLAANLVLMLGSMMVLTYLAPYVGALADAGPGERGVLFAVSGIAGMVGIWAGGAATDRWGPDRTLVAGVAAFVASMAALLALWPWRPASLAVLLPVVAVWGGAAFWNSPAVQARLHMLSGPVATQALALNTSGTYLGVAAGGAIGGAVLGAGGLAQLPVVVAAAGLVALGLFVAARRSARQTSTLG
ncbi:MFS transporter [Saccharomonospora cyanea]|uniref:Arabinose efflux permease family protein n=1 Tax=Saccharomonospora cyanea NA-134 TaxID=882082 RepID=H5XJ16_9PSEU|nr:MFS transporter [Saccharomonospora cyanea]EHR61792.1 arabinose efflux permease family protein [Saccharomonospora cyanea NA-134]